MAQENRPTIVRLAVYWIAAAGMTGLVSGLAFATGVAEWAYEELTPPVFLPPVMILTWAWIAKTMLMTLALWTVDRFGTGWVRWLAMLAITLLFAASAGWLTGFVILRDVTFGFYAILLSFGLTVFAMLFVGRASKAAGFMMWPIFGWTLFMLAASFELMRLNTDIQLVGF